MVAAIVARGGGGGPGGDPRPPAPAARAGKRAVGVAPVGRALAAAPARTRDEGRERVGRDPSAGELPRSPGDAAPAAVAAPRQRRERLAAVARAGHRRIRRTDSGVCTAAVARARGV